MNFYFYLSLAGFFVTAALVINVLSVNFKDKINQAFARLTMAISIWNFGNMMGRLVTTYPEAALWDKFASIGWCFVPPLFVHFILRFSRRDAILAKIWVWAPMYLLSFLWLYLKFFTGFIQTGPVIVTNESILPFLGKISEWDVIVHPGFIFYMIHLLLSFVIGFYFLILNWVSKNKVLRQQSIIIFWGTLIPFSIGYIFDAVLPLFNLHIMRLAGVDAVVFVIFVAYAISRYQFMLLNPTRVADRILSTMPDMLLLIDPNQKIISINRALSETLAISPDKLIGQSLDRIFSPGSTIPKPARLISSIGTAIHTRDAEFIAASGEKIPVILSSSVVFDLLGDELGQIIIAKDIRERKEFIGKLQASEKSLENINNRLNAILTNMFDAIIIENQSHTVEFMNRQAVSYLQNQVGKKCYETLLGGSPGQPVCAVDSLLKQEKETKVNAIQTQDGRFFELIGSRLLDSDGQIKVLQIIRDVSESKKAEKALQEKMDELKTMNDIAVGRELKMIEYEKEINELYRQQGKEEKYKPVT